VEPRRSEPLNSPIACSIVIPEHGPGEPPKLVAQH
jgi:hypothetical protein